MTTGAITAALVLDGMQALSNAQRAELVTLLGMDISSVVPTADAVPLTYTAVPLDITERTVHGPIAPRDLRQHAGAEACASLAPTSRRGSLPKPSRAARPREAR